MATTVTFNPGTGAVDGVVYRFVTQEAYSTIRSGAGNGVADTASSDRIAGIRAGTTSNLWDFLVRSIFLFNASSLPDNAVITGARLGLYVTAKGTGIASQSLVVVSATPASDSALAVSDYGNLGTTAYSSTLALSGITTSAYNYLDLNAAGIAAISLTGITRLGIRMESDRANSMPTWVSAAIADVSAQYVEGANDPILEVTYEIPAGIPSVDTTSRKKKRFVFKVKDRTGVSLLKSTEDWEFDSITRSVNASMSMKVTTDILTKNVGNAITNPMNQVSLIVSSPYTGSAGLEYFSGYIANRVLNLKSNDERVAFDAMGHASRLEESLYRDGATIIMDFSATGDQASDIAKDIITKFQALDANWPVTYDSATVEDSSDTIKDKFKLQTAMAALQRCVFLAYDANAIWYWFIKGDKKFYFKKAPSTATHKFTYGKDVSEFPELSEDLLQGKNEIFVQYNGGANVKRVADSTSITNYGNRSLVVNESSVPDSTTATEIANAYLAQYTPPLRKVKVTISDVYGGGIENIHPGETCKIMNLPTQVASLLSSNMFIAKTVYKKYSVDLELALQHPQIGNQVDKIRKRIEKQETDDDTATTYA